MRKLVKKKNSAISPGFATPYHHHYGLTIIKTPIPCMDIFFLLGKASIPVCQGQFLKNITASLSYGWYRLVLNRGTFWQIFTPNVIFYGFHCLHFHRFTWCLHPFEGGYKKRVSECTHTAKPGENHDQGHCVVLYSPMTLLTKSLFFRCDPVCHSVRP